MKNHKFFDNLSTILLLIGGLCLGLVGAFNMEPISMVLGGGDMTAPIVRIIYVLIGLSAIYRIVMWAKSRK